MSNIRSTPTAGAAGAAVEEPAAALLLDAPFLAFDKDEMVVPPLLLVLPRSGFGGGIRLVEPVGVLFDDVDLYIIGLRVKDMLSYAARVDVTNAV